MATATACAEDTSRHTRIYASPRRPLPDLETAGEPEVRAMCERAVHSPVDALALAESPAHVQLVAVLVDRVYTRIEGRDDQIRDLEERVAARDARIEELKRLLRDENAAAESAERRAERLSAALVEVQTELDNARAAHIRAANRKLRENQDAINSAPRVSLGGGEACTQAMAAGDLEERERDATATYERELQSLGAARLTAWFDTSDVAMGGAS